MSYELKTRTGATEAVLMTTAVFLNFMRLQTRLQNNCRLYF
jgi:hypothetical protein